MSREAYEKSIKILIDKAGEELTGSDYRSLITSLKLYLDGVRIDSVWDEDDKWPSEWTLDQEPF